MFLDWTPPRFPALDDPPALRAVAAWFRRHADAADARAAMLERDAKRLRQAKATLARVADARGALPLELLTPDERRARRRSERRLRNQEIMRAAGRGWTNAEIAARMNLHPSSVSRIVQAALRANRPLAGDARSA